MTVRIKIILGLLYLVIFSMCPLKSFSQNIHIVIDTTDYLPYPFGLNYNLMIASSKGYSDEVTRLIRLGADIESKTAEGVTPLMFAVANNNLECVKVLLSEGANPNIDTKYNETPLLAAVKNGNAGITEALLRSNAEVNLSDNSGASPLHYAAINGNLSITDMLLYYKSNVDNKTNDGTTPLMSAVWVGYADVADLLIQNGADVNNKDANGFSSLLIAAQNGDTLLLSLLLKAGADIYATNKYNYNALCLAIKENHIETIHYLLKQGNLWNSSLNNALNPITVATKYRRKDIIALLENNNIRQKLIISFDQVSVSGSGRFASNDLFTGLAFKIKEPLLNAGIIFGSDFKPFDTRVIIHTGESEYYQFIDRRSVVYAGLFKDFDITERSHPSFWSLSLSLTGAYSFGNHFKGTSLSPTKKFNIMPSIYLQWQKYNISFHGGLDYMKTEFYKVGPLWLRLGFTYSIYFDKVRSPGKMIKWY